MVFSFSRKVSLTSYDLRSKQKEFISQAWEVVGRKVEKKLTLSDICETAKDSIGLPIAANSEAIRMFRMVLAEGRSLIRQRDTIEARGDELLSNQEDYKLLRSIPGIGPISALTILAEAGDVRRFRHHRQFLKFSGLDLATIQSGMFRARSKISKYGNARLRWMLSLAAYAAVLKRVKSFGMSLRDISQKIDTTLICLVKRLPQLPQKWRAQFMP